VTGGVAARRFVSRGGEKLDGALKAFALDVAGKRALDAGASTGGFTDCLLARGAAYVVAVDVGYGQLAWELRTDPRVHVLERTNARSIARAQIGPPVDLVVADLSFISLEVVADGLLAVAKPEAELVLLVKPQFELPRDRVPRGGVVKDTADWVDAMKKVATAYRKRGCVLVSATPSTLTGPKGNREFFLLLERAGIDSGDDAILRAAKEAP
jgi:23S rRNA (cytidine1920-2'-O)/16S rRNA (cytidine1409-2'-O)-methyltransferase